MESINGSEWLLGEKKNSFRAIESWNYSLKIEILPFFDTLTNSVRTNIYDLDYRFVSVFLCLQLIQFQIQQISNPKFAADKCWKWITREKCNK